MDFRISMAVLCVASEAGEVAGYLKKTIGHGHEPSIAKLAEELGDTLWGVSDLCTCFGVELEELAGLVELDAYQEHEARGVFEHSVIAEACRLSRVAGQLAGTFAEAQDAGKRMQPEDVVILSIFVLRYIARCAHVAGLSLAAVAEANVDKNRIRYPNGFTEEASAARVDTAI
jgi:NTP pyrophosphatase (non-canonical NTP hydrolase)